MHLYLRCCGLSQLNTGGDDKFWLTPVVRLARAGRYCTHELSDIIYLVEANQQEFLEAWHAYFE